MLLIKGEDNNLPSTSSNTEVNRKQCKHPKVIYAHRNILSARCAPFRVMFSIGMKETREQRIRITNARYQTFYALLEYLYTGQLSVSTEIISELLELADLYTLEHLKSLCEQKMIRFVDMDNCLSLLSLADKYQAPALKLHCVRFIIRQYQLSLQQQVSVKKNVHDMFASSVSSSAPSATLPSPSAPQQMGSVVGATQVSPPNDRKNKGSGHKSPPSERKLGQEKEKRTKSPSNEQKIRNPQEQSSSAQQSFSPSPPRQPPLPQQQVVQQLQQLQLQHQAQTNPQPTTPRQPHINNPGVSTLPQLSLQQVTLATIPSPPASPPSLSAEKKKHKRKGSRGNKHDNHHRSVSVDDKDKKRLLVDDKDKDKDRKPDKGEASINKKERRRSSGHKVEKEKVGDKQRIKVETKKSLKSSTKGETAEVQFSLLESDSFNLLPTELQEEVMRALLKETAHKEYL